MYSDLTAAVIWWLDIRVVVALILGLLSNVDFQAAYAGGPRAVFHKASQGIYYTDPLYASARAKATAAGLLWGAYQFGTSDDALAQAEHFPVAVPATATASLAAMRRPWRRFGVRMPETMAPGRPMNS